MGVCVGVDVCVCVGVGVGGRVCMGGVGCVRVNDDL